jgi:AraC family transcriptional regulator
MASDARQETGERRMAPGSFYGSIAHRKSVGGAIFTELRHDHPRKLPTHSHEMPFFCLFFAGDYGEQYGRQYMQFRPFTLSFRPAGVPHMDEIGPRGARMFGIEASNTWQAMIESASGDLSIAYDLRGGDRLWLALKLYRETCTGNEADDLQVESLMAEMLALTGCPPERTHDAPPWLRRVKDRIEGEFRQRLTLESLAAEVAVHPVHLSRSFRRFSGCGLGEYLRRLRVRHACELMLGSELSLAEIGFTTGFADQSHFTRTCHTITGASPGALRALLRQNGATSAAILCPRPS